MWVQECTVEGAGAFPVDMLRYDSCHPADATAVEGIVMSNSDPEGRHVRDRRRKVRLISCTPTKKHRWSEGRWNSFGWAVVSSRVWKA